MIRAARVLPLVALSLVIAFACAAQETRPSHADPSVPVPKSDAGFMKQHEAFLKRTTQGPVDLLFLGDSITAGWATKGKDVWEQFYDKYHPANFGIGGDHVQNVLWRIENGELEHISPKVAVLMIGTNDSAANTADEISAGIEKLVGEIRQKLPNTKILLLAIFPRGPHNSNTGKFDDGVERMRVIRDVNARIAKLDDGKTVRYLDIGGKFLTDGKIPDDVMADQLHPTARGYQIWADAMQPLLEEMMR